MWIVRSGAIRPADEVLRDLTADLTDMERQDLMGKAGPNPFEDGGDVVFEEDDDIRSYYGDYEDDGEDTADARQLSFMAESVDDLLQAAAIRLEEDHLSVGCPADLEADSGLCRLCRVLQDLQAGNELWARDSLDALCPHCAYKPDFPG